MTESERLASNATATLRSQGWPDYAIKNLVFDLMEAGYRKCIEDQEKARMYKETMLTKAGESFKGNTQ